MIRAAVTVDTSSMGTKLITELTPASTLTGDELMPIAQVGGTRKATLNQLVELVPAGPEGPAGPPGSGGGSVLALASANNASLQNVGGAGGPTPVNAALTVTFTAPASGQVMVMLQAGAYGNPGDSGTHWLLTSSGTPVDDTSKFITALGAANTIQYSVLIPLIVTPDTSYTWLWEAKGSYAGGGYATTYGGIYGAAVMTVFAA